MKVILTHTNSDFDAVASLLGAHKLYPDAEPVLPNRLNRNVREFVALYANALPFNRTKKIKGPQISEIILVDTQTLPQMHGLNAQTPTTIIDHHPRTAEFSEAHITAHIDEVGSASTLLVERIQQSGVVLSPLEATLLALGIYEDTGSMTYGTTDVRDIRAAAWLLEQHAVLDTVRRFLAPPLTQQQQTIYESLIAKTESRVLNGHTVIVCATEIDEHVQQLNSIAHRLRDTLDPAALFMVVKMPSYIQLICRGTDDAVDVGEVARQFGGGGHARAASAAVKSEDLPEVVHRLWTMLPALVHPVTTVAELMSQGAKTVGADQRIENVIRELRRVGHEGYPVMDNERIIGLLKLRDADRAMEHGLHRSHVREIMEVGEYTLTPDDSVTRLEQMIVESGWGQIPVVSPKGELLGIVTRTDLINHWVQSHPAIAPRQTRIEAERIAEILGPHSSALIRLIAKFAQDMNIHLYLVGGIVRDLLLDRPNFDIDFVIETNGQFTGGAIGFAEQLEAQYGGHVSSYKPFGTAKWRMNEDVAAKLGVSIDDLPHSIDFATSRNEFYERPTALPTVYAGSIKLDLHRRDFTINTLAIQMSPHAVEGRIIDFYGGLNDLRSGIIRVLHSLSFIDDPTRVIRAVRFKHRLGFKIDPRTAELISTAHTVLRRITGERIRNELTLLFRESQPENALLDLQERGVLAAIHPAFVIDERLRGYFEQARALDEHWLGVDFKLSDLYWHLIFAHIDPEQAYELGERLLIGKPTTMEIKNVAELVRAVETWTGDEKPSQIAARLDDLRDITLLTVWVVCQAQCRAIIEQYQQTWQHVRPLTSGHDLRKLGLVAGPQYKIMLDRLRAAWLDGDISDAGSEKALLDELLKDGEFEA